MGSESADGRGRKIVPEEEAATVSHAGKRLIYSMSAVQNGIDCEGQPTPVADEECGDRYAAGDGEQLPARRWCCRAGGAISGTGAAAIESGYGFFWPLCGAKTVCAG